MSIQKILIVGTGFSGSTIARLLAESGHKVERISDLQLKLTVNDDYSFHFVTNQYSVDDENPYIISSYSGSKDIESIIKQKNRIEFWGDDDSSEALFINDYIFALEKVQKITDVSIFWPKNNIFIDEVN